MEPHLARWWTLPSQRRPLPYMCAAHAAYLGDLAARSTLIVEYGAGGSTLFLALLAGRGSTLISVEPEGVWREAISRWAEAFRNCDFDMATIDAKAHPGLFRGLVDLVFVDGETGNRPEQMAEGWPLLRRGGSLVLHDSQRPAYQTAKTRILESGGHFVSETFDDMGAGLWHAKRVGDFAPGSP